MCFFLFSRFWLYRRWYTRLWAGRLTIGDIPPVENSRDLQDEIAQTLLAIDARLLTLNEEAAINAKGLKKEIVNTQRLVDMLVRCCR